MKRSAKDCFCALCRTPRKLRYSRNLTKLHYGQIVIITLVFSALVFPLISWKGLISFPVIWAIFESFHKSLYRKDLQCPYCGFDPKWYKKDVKLARQKVEEFLKQNPDTHVLKRAKLEENSYTQYN
jgi:hypothetical protein